MPWYMHLVSKSGPTLGPVDLNTDIPPVLHLVAKSGTKMDLVDLSSDVLPGRGI